MTRTQEKVLARGLWTIYAVLAAVGLALLGETLFLRRAPAAFSLKMPSVEAMNELQPLPAAKDGLLDRRFTRRVASAPSAPGPAKPAEVPLDRLIKLTGILDFGGKKPSLAVIETPGESKAYKAGDKVGETGVLIKDVKDYVVVEFEKRRFKVTFLGVEELPANAFGKD